MSKDAKHELGDLFPETLLKLLKSGECDAATMSVIRAYLKDAGLHAAPVEGSSSRSLLDLAKQKGVLNPGTLRLNGELPPLDDSPDAATA